MDYSLCFLYIEMIFVISRVKLGIFFRKYTQKTTIFDTFCSNKLNKSSKSGSKSLFSIISDLSSIDTNLIFIKR